MTETQQLLSSTSPSSIDDGNNDTKRSVTSLLQNWREFFSLKQRDQKYEQLDRNTNEAKTESVISYFQLFHYADQLDIFIIILGLCFALLYGVAVAGHIIMFGELTGIVVTQSFVGRCPTEQNTSLNITNNSICQWSADKMTLNHNQTQKFCLNESATLAPLWPVFIATFRTEIIKYLKWLLIFGVMELVSIAAQCLLFTMAAKRQTSRIRILLFKSLLQRNISYCDMNSMGQFDVKIFNNIDQLNKGIGIELSILLGVLFSAICCACVALIINWKLALIIIFTAPFAIGGSCAFSKIIMKESRNELNMYSTAGEIVQEVFNSLRTVLSLNGGKFESKRYKNKLQATHLSSVRKGAAFGLLNGWIYLIGYIIYSIGFSFGLFLMHYESSDKFDLADLIVIVFSLSRMITYVAFISPFFQSLEEARSALTPIFHLIDEGNNTSLNETHLWQNSAIYQNVINMAGDIHFENINFAYPARPDILVLRNLSLTFRAGEKTALVGSSGSGKSTCISLLLRFYEPSSGSITIDGQSINESDLKELRQKIGVVNQEPILFATSIYENIRFGKQNAIRIEIEDAARQASAHDFIMKLPNKYDTIVGELGIQLSGGEKQRVALARALVKQPTLLLLDEATSALDSVNEKIVQEALDRACKGRTTIVIAHRLATIQNAHHIYVFDNGCVVEQGTHTTLISQEKSQYQEMMKAQQLENLDDNIDLTSCIEQIQDEDEKEILESIRHRSHSAFDDNNKDSSVINDRPAFFRLLLMNSPEWYIILIGCLACLISGGSQTVYVVLLVYTVDAFGECTYEERSHQIFIFSFIFLLIGVVVLVIRFIQYTAFAVSGSKLTQRIRVTAFTHLLRQEMAFFDRPENNSGAICNRLSSDALAIQQMTGARLGIVCEAIATFGFGIVLGFIFSWHLTLIVLICTTIFFILAFMQIRWQAKLNERSGSVLGSASSLAVEILHNMRTVKQLASETEFVYQFSSLVLNEFTVRRHDTIISTVLYTLNWGTASFILAALYWEVFVLVEHKELTLSSIPVVFAYYIFSMESWRVITILMRQMSESLSAARNFFKLFDRIPAIDNSSLEGHKINDFQGKIEFDEVKFAYASRPMSYVLNKFKLTIKPGQRVALIGASGCGKSTVIQLLERFYNPTQGRIYIDGIDIRKLNIQWLRSCLGLVSQEPILFNLTIAENIAYGTVDSSMNDIIDAATKANIHNFIQDLPQGYETNVGMKGSHLSGGEKQRIAIARALLRRPKILLLDEASSAMDSYNEHIVQEALEKAETEDPSRTSLIVAHRLSTISSCNLICVLAEGCLVESGTHADLMERRGVYYHMIARNIIG